MKTPDRSDEVTVRLRSDDVEVLLVYCESILDQDAGPHRWIWWRIRQACIAAITAAGVTHVVDRHLY
ncbi:MAG: hypothetical protein OWQ57_05530 [Sulfobacillus sp.]|nr:hypothetical protein [Sulfobacillus sp.]